MNFFIIAVATICTFAPAASVAETPQAPTRISKPALTTAGRQAKLESIDYGRHHCDRDSTVETWLKSLVGRHARAITWTGGDCQLVNNMRPEIDAASWPWCVRAAITLAHPKNRHDIPMIEVYVEKPDHGRPDAGSFPDQRWSGGRHGYC
jgi:hypothetical protein